MSTFLRSAGVVVLAWLARVVLNASITMHGSCISDGLGCPDLLGTSGKQARDHGPRCSVIYEYE